MFSVHRRLFFLLNVIFSRFRIAIGCPFVWRSVSKRKLIIWLTACGPCDGTSFTNKSLLVQLILTFARTSAAPVSFITWIQIKSRLFRSGVWMFDSLRPKIYLLFSLFLIELIVQHGIQSLLYLSLGISSFLFARSQNHYLIRTRFHHRSTVGRKHFICSFLVRTKPVFMLRKTITFLGCVLETNFCAFRWAQCLRESILLFSLFE